ncbi:MAG: ABC transporter permease [Deltaproteobacteria bacterium]|nr:ABC transporter permease [Deltaproteobacteria bacterium]
MPDRPARPPAHPLLELTWARMLEFAREPGAVFWTFGFPVLLAIGLGVAFRARPPEPVRYRISGDASIAADVRDALEGSVGIEAVDLQEPDLDRALQAGRIDVVVQPTVREEGTLEVTYRYDPERDAGRLGWHLVDDALQRARGRTDVVEVREAPERSPGVRYIDFLIPGLIGLNVMGSSMWGTAYNIVLARRRRLLKRLAATPMRRSHFLLSFVGARLLFLASEVVALVIAGRLLFGVIVRGSLTTLGLVSLLGSLAFMGLALLVASRPRDTEVAAGWMNVVMLPQYLLSGAFFSWERFPEVLHPVLRLLPLTAFNDATRAVFNQGASLVSLGPELAVLSVWTVACFFLALRHFRWQ